ncbi:MAG: metal ABC transporter ATP-binding protein [Desulfitobacteriia bacterium]|jgi:zinc transport system ATP-binding protein
MTRTYLEIKNLKVQKEKITILENINVLISSGEMVALVGPNGSGKSTLFRTLIGETSYSGEINYFNHNREKFKPRIGYVPQKLQLEPDSPVSVLDLFGACLSKRPVWSGQSRKFKKNPKLDLAPIDINSLRGRRLGELSGGELQRVLLTLAMDPTPDVLLLDEPFSAIDQNDSEALYKMVADLACRLNMITIIVSHELDLAAQYAQRVIFLNRTIQATGTPEEVIRNEKFKLAYKNLNVENFIKH